MTATTVGALRTRVRRMTWEAEGVLPVELVAADGGELPAREPGANIDLDLPPRLS
jgi:hypothetical protein